MGCKIESICFIVAIKLDLYELLFDLLGKLHFLFSVLASSSFHIMLFLE